jgi:hypothetical protein
MAFDSLWSLDSPAQRDAVPKKQALKRLRHIDLDLGWHFAATVLTTLAAYGVALGW